MLDMIDYLKGAFKKIIEDIDWMDDLTKERAFDKLKTMRRFIAYPDELTEESVVTEYHAGVDVDEEDFYGNDASSNLTLIWRIFNAGKASKNTILLIFCLLIMREAQSL